MQTEAPTEPARLRWLRIALFIGLPLALALTIGLDSNWDLRNYHLYNAHALLHGRVADIAPAQLQSFHNPLLDLPFYLLTASGMNPRLGAVWLALPAVLGLFLLARMRSAMQPASPRHSLAADLALVLMVLAGAATWSTFASTMNDAFAAAAMLGALAILLCPAQAPTPRHWLFAGLVAGGFAGLKLSNAFYCIALALAAIPGGSFAERARRLVALGLGGAAGFAITYGAWGWHLYSEHGNPFFPYYNDWFRSPDARLEPYTDLRFRQHGLDILLAPIHLLGKTTRFSEEHLRDPRLLVGMLSMAWLWWKQRAAPVASRQRERVNLLAMFFFAATALWLLQYGIYRYAIVLEQLACLALVLVIAPSAGGKRWMTLWIAVLLMVGLTHRPNRGREADDLPRPGFDRPGVDQRGMVVTATPQPMAYFALGLPDDVPMLALDSNMVQPPLCTGLRERADRALAQHHGRIWLLAPATGVEMERGQFLLERRYGLGPAGACVSWKSSLGKALLCPQQRIGPAHPPACP